MSKSLVTAVYERPVFYDKSNKLYSSKVLIIYPMIHIYQYLLKFEALNGDN